MVFESTAYLQSRVLHIGLHINPTTSASNTVQLPFNKQGFEQSLGGQAMKNHYHCRPISNIPLQLTGSYWLLKWQQLIITLFGSLFQ
jgi:hypothetical protein